MAQAISREDAPRIGGLEFNALLVGGVLPKSLFESARIEDATVIYDANGEVLFHRPHTQRGATMTRPAYISALGRRFRLANMDRGLVVALFLSLIFLVEGCASGAFGGLQPVAQAIGREGYRFSVLTWNSEGIREDYDNPTVIVPRKTRYGRVAKWMKDAATTPDIIGIQEVVLAKKRNLLPALAEDWDMPWEIITAIRDQTGVTYRVAYFVVDSTPQGWNPPTHTGLMVLYNPARIRHLPISGPATAWDSLQQTGAYVRSSPAPSASKTEYNGLIPLVDGPAWVGSFRRTNNTFDLGPAYARFSLVNTPDARFSTYQLHFASSDPNSFTSLRDFVNLMEQNFGGNDTYPPVMLGDFNVSQGNMNDETTQRPGGTFDGFYMAGYYSDDVMGVLAGRQQVTQTPAGVTQGKFKSKFPLVVDPGGMRILPNELPRDGRNELGGGGQTTWGDHIAIYVEFFPY